MISQDTHVASADKDNTHLFDGKFEVITEKDGEKLYDWANQGEKPTPKVPQPTYSEPTVSDEDILKDIKKEIISLCTQLGGTKNESLMVTLKEFVPSGNPNALREVQKAKDCLNKIKSIKSVQA